MTSAVLRQPLFGHKQAREAVESEREEGGGGHIIHVRSPEDHGPSYLYNTETKHVGFSPSPPVLIAPNANRREASGESYEGRAASYYVPLVSRIWAPWGRNFLRRGRCYYVVYGRTGRFK